MTTEARATDDRRGYPPPALTALVLGLFAVVLAVSAVIAIAETSALAFASYSSTQATVVDEHVEEVLVADRRGSSLDVQRFATVELPDGTTADVRSEDLEVGTTATVFLSTSGGVYETPPQRPGALEWALCAAVIAAAILLAVAAVRATVRLRRRG